MSEKTLVYVAETEELKPRRFTIKHDKFAGFYLYVYKNDRCTHDYLQDTLEIAMKQAFEDFHVPRDSWKKVA